MYIIATPIGNLADISPRAVEVLKNADAVLAEDTRVSKKLFDRFGINTPLISYRQQSIKDEKLLLKIVSLINEGKKLALITDAGTPAVSDPGNELLDYLYSVFDNFEAIPIPGPSSVMAALSVSGFKASEFYFGGYIPKKKRSKWFKKLSNIESTIVYFDSPYRVIKNLEEVKEKLGERKVLVAREMTKMHEQYLRGDITLVINKLQKNTIKGEFVIVIDGLI